MVNEWGFFRHSQALSAANLPVTSVPPRISPFRRVRDLAGFRRSGDETFSDIEGMIA